MSNSLTALYLQNPELATALRRQESGRALMKEGMDASPIQSPWQGVARLAAALMGGWEAGRGDKEIKEAGDKRQALLARLMADDDMPSMPAQSAPAAAPAPAMTAPPPGPVARMPMAPPDLAPFIEEQARARGIPPPLATSLFATESNFNPMARNPRTGAFGIGQVLSSTAAQPGFGMQPISEADLADPRKAIPWSLDYLKARGGALGVQDFNDPQQAARALRAYGENTDEYERKVLGGAGMLPQPGAQMAAGNAPASDATNVQAPQMGQSGQDYLAMAQRAQARARAAAVAGETALAQQFQNEATLYRQVALQRQPQPTADMQLLEAAGYRRGTPEFEQAARDLLMKKGANNFLIPPAAPADYMYQQDQNGRLTMVPIPGGKADKTERRSEEQKARAGGIVIDDIKRIEALGKDAFLPVAGFGASTAATIPGTAAHDVSKLLDGIKANIGIQTLNEMRQASPTGGALGSVTERENEMVQSVYGSLAQSQSSDQFSANLKRLKRVILDIVHGPGKWVDPDEGADKAPPPPPPGFQPVQRR